MARVAKLFPGRKVLFDGTLPSDHGKRGVSAKGRYFGPENAAKGSQDSSCWHSSFASHTLKTETERLKIRCGVGKRHGRPHMLGFHLWSAMLKNIGMKLSIAL